MSSPHRPSEPPTSATENANQRGLLDAVVEHHDDHHAAVVRLAGEIDSYTASTLGDAVAEALGARTGLRLLVIDLARVEFIGSQGLAQLIAAADRTERADMTLRLAAANATVRMILSVTGTTALFDLRPTVADALAEPPSPATG